MFNTRSERAAQSVVSDFGEALSNAQRMLREAGTRSGHRADRLRAQADAQLKAASKKLQDAQDKASEASIVAAKNADKYVRDRPWHAMGMAAVVGVALGVLLGGRR